MRQLKMLSERGSANWPFIITLILMLAFGYLWFDERDKREVAQADAAKNDIAADAAYKTATRFLEELDQLSQMVGYADKDAKSLIPPAAGDDKKEKEAERIGRELAGSRVITNLEKLKANLTPDGTVEGGEPGLLNSLITQAEVEIVKDIRSQGSDEVAETPAQFDWMTSEFKAKLAEINAMEIPKPPVPVSDPDDPSETARYQDELAAFEEAVAAYQTALDELQQMEGYKKWDKIIKPPRRFNPDQREVVKLEFFTQALTGTVTVETVFGYPKRVIPLILQELKRNKEADAGIIDQARSDSNAKQQEIDRLQAELAQEQQRHTTDVQQLQGELAVANETAESNRLEATNALQRVQVVEEEMRRAVAERESNISALQNRIRIDKEERDLKIRRDETDGSILSSSPTMGTAIVNLGSADKVYPGLKFNVSYYGRGGIRLPKGQVQVVKVLGDHSAKVAVVAEDPGNPVSRGDIIHNALWSKTDTIHVFFAGELEKYPIEVAKSRLEKMGVVIDAQVSGDTDYIVVPNAMAAPAPAASEDDEGGDEEAVAGQSEFDRISNLARTFGATVITEKVFNQFLDF